MPCCFGGVWFDAALEVPRSVAPEVVGCTLGWVHLGRAVARRQPYDIGEGKDKGKGIYQTNAREEEVLPLTFARGERLVCEAPPRPRPLPPSPLPHTQLESGHVAHAFRRRTVMRMIFHG
ncbi:hypothetical protein N9L68_05475 [bacterium]|nr:hypothetical protein [bacterium]